MSLCVFISTFLAFSFELNKALSLFDECALNVVLNSWLIEVCRSSSKVSSAQWDVVVRSRIIGGVPDDVPSYVILPVFALHLVNIFNVVHMHRRSWRYDFNSWAFRWYNRVSCGSSLSWRSRQSCTAFRWCCHWIFVAIPSQKLFDFANSVSVINWSVNQDWQQIERFRNSFLG